MRDFDMQLRHQKQGITRRIIPAFVLIIVELQIGFYCFDEGDDADDDDDDVLRCFVSAAWDMS
jgi:hypothetical protein